MEFTQVVQNRRSVFKFTEQAVSFEELLPLISLATLAPNHHLTQPWQFIWVGEQTKSQLAEHYAFARASKKLDINSPDFLAEKARAHRKFCATPAILMVTCRVDDNPIIANEDYAATCCAVQTLLLALTNAGLGAQWSSHPMIHDPSVLSLLGLTTQDRVVAMLYIGYPAIIPPAPPRNEASTFVRQLA